MYSGMIDFLFRPALIFYFMLRHKKEDFVYCFFSGIVYTYNRKQGSGQKKRGLQK
jgi:hypothetical protein